MEMDNLLFKLSNKAHQLLVVVVEVVLLNPKYDGTGDISCYLDIACFAKRWVDS